MTWTRLTTAGPLHVSREKILKRIVAWPKRSRKLRQENDVPRPSWLLHGSWLKGIIFSPSPAPNASSFLKRMSALATSTWALKNWERLTRRSHTMQRQGFDTLKILWAVSTGERRP